MELDEAQKTASRKPRSGAAAGADPEELRILERENEDLQRRIRNLQEEVRIAGKSGAGPESSGGNTEVRQLKLKLKHFEKMLSELEVERAELRSKLTAAERLAAAYEKQLKAK